MIPAALKDKLAYIPEGDRKLPAEQQTIFYILPMSVRKFREWKNLFTTEGDVQFTFERTMELLNDFVVGWKNVRGGNGTPIEFKLTPEGKSDPSNWDDFGVGQLQEIVIGVIEVNEIATVQRKN